MGFAIVPAMRAACTTVRALAEVALRRGVLDAATAKRLAGDKADDAGAARRLLADWDPAQRERLLPLLADAPAIGGFRPLAILADGSGSLVWLAEREGRPAVLKHLRPELAPSLSFDQRFTRETGAIAGIDHVHIARHLGDGRADGRPWLAMEYVPGSDLHALLVRRGRLDEADALVVARHLARALDVAHRAGLVHRDLKPSNVLIGTDGRVRLADFGLACAPAEQGALTMQGTVIGTAAWLAPERVRGEVAGAGADLYALGCLLFAALTGTTPFAGDRATVQRAHRTAPAPDGRAAVPGVGEGTAKVILKCLAKRPEDRYANAADLHRSLGRELERLGAGNRDLLSAPVLAALPSCLAPLPDSVATLPVAGADGFAGEAFAGERLTLVEADAVGEAHVVTLFARADLVFGGRLAEGADVWLRVYPPERHAHACRRISRRHLRVGLDDEGAWVEDLGSTNGTLVAGACVPLETRRRLDPGTVAIAIPDGLDLSATVVPPRRRPLALDDAGRGPDALTLARVGNRPRLAYALVRRQLTIGGPGADLALAAHRSSAAIAIARHRGAWWWRDARADDAAWQAVVPGQALTVMGLALLPRAGDAADFA